VTVTLQTARAAVRERLGESRPRAWKDTELDRWIYEGCVALARRCETLQTTFDHDLAAATQSFTMPADVLRIYRCEWQDDGETTRYTLDYRDFNNADAVWWTSQETSQGRPIMYTMWGFPPNLKAVLYPTPYQAGTVRIYYYRVPMSWADQKAASAEWDTPYATFDDTILEVPSGWEDAVYLYAEYCALRKDNDQRWQEAQALYMERENGLYEMTRRWTDQPGQAVGGNYPMANAWLYADDGGGW